MLAEEGSVEPTAAGGRDEARVGPPDGRHREQEEDEAMRRQSPSVSTVWPRCIVSQLEYVVKAASWHCCQPLSSKEDEIQALSVITVTVGKPSNCLLIC